MKIIKKGATVFFLILLGLVTGLFTAEAVLRVAYDMPAQKRAMRILGFRERPDIEPAYIHKPNCSICMPRTNSLGFPGPDPLPPARGLIRIFVLGDSVCAGYSLPYEKTFPARLEQALSGFTLSGEKTHAVTKIKVFSFCVGAFDLPEISSVMKKVAVPRKPDLILALHFVNDDGRTFLTSPGNREDTDGYAAMVTKEGKKFGPMSWLPENVRSFLESNSYLYQEVRWRALSLWLQVMPADDIPTDRSERELSDLIESEVKASSLAQIPFGVILAPSATYGKCRLGPSWNPDRFRLRCSADDLRLDRMKRLFSNAGASVLDLRPVFDDPKLDLTLGPEHAGDLDHWGPKGHILAAKTTAPFAVRLLFGKRLSTGD
ncbi:MAG: hypothetical protein GXP49_06040 [Deltaproteobacteria bacterium]|nr:hypothetical protein [Deltaproteobacteria bacterium]